MRIACIAGFFNPVHKALEKRFAKEIESKCVIWIPQIGNGQFSINLLKQALFQAVEQGAENFLFLLFVLRGHEYLIDGVNSLVAEAQARAPSMVITIKKGFKDAQDGPGIVKMIEAYQPRPKAKQYPETLDSLDAWIATNHSATVILHPRAKNNSIKSQYLDVRLIYQAIELLANEYYLMRTSKQDQAEARKATCDSKLKNLELDLSPSISATRMGEEGEDYEVPYPVGQIEKKETLDLHLKKGSDRDERYCLRIYFSGMTSLKES